MRVDCERASLVVWGVLKSQGVGGPSGVPGGVGVRNLKSGFERRYAGRKEQVQIPESPQEHFLG
jgi:hypothetical protein